LVGPRTRRLSLGAESAVRNPTLYFLQAPVAPHHRQQDCPKCGPEWISQSKREEKKKIPHCFLQGRRNGRYAAEGE